MNAGGHGSDVAAVLLDVVVADLRCADPDRMVRTLTTDDLLWPFFHTDRSLLKVLLKTAS